MKALTFLSALVVCFVLNSKSNAAQDVTTLQSKLDSIQLPDIEFKETPFREAVEQLRTLSVSADPEPDPEKKGVIFVTKIDDSESTPPPITAKLQKPTLAAAIAEVAKQANYQVKIEKFAVTFVPLIEAPSGLSESVLSAARNGDGARIQAILDDAFAKDARLDENWAAGLLNLLLENREPGAFRTLLAQMRQTNLGKKWQPTDAQLVEVIRDERKDFVDILLSLQLDPARLKNPALFPDESMKAWTIKRVAAIEKERADIHALIAACGKGDLPEVQRLLDAGVDVNGRSVDGQSWTPLTKASSSGKIEIVKLLLERGADPNLPKHPGWDYTPLCLTRSSEVADLLKAAGANIHAKLFRRDVSILTYVAMHNGAPMVQWFLDQGLDPKMIGDNNRTLLFSVKDGATAEILLEAGVDPNHVDEFGEVAIQTARGGDVIEALIKGGAKTTGLKHPLLATLIRENSGSAIEAALNILPPQAPEELQGALIAAAHMGRDKAAEALLKHGAKANVESEWAPGDSVLPLMVCCIFGSEKVARVLLAHGADPNAGKIPGRMLRNAIMNQHEGVVKALREAGAKGASELCVAVAMDDKESVRNLLANTPRFDGAPEFWEGVIETAAGKNNLDVVVKALDAGVPPQLEIGRDAFAAAASEGHHETLSYLLTKRKPEKPEVLKQALWNAVWNSHPYEEQRPALDFEKCVQLLLEAGVSLNSESNPQENLVSAAVFTRNPGGNPKVLEMLIAAGADPNPVMPDGSKFLDLVSEASKQGGCSTPSFEMLQSLQKLKTAPKE